MAERTLPELERENAYLKLRLAQLQSDVVDITAENHRLAQVRERLAGRRAARPPNPLGDGN
jgi:hypothetical protein